MHSGAVSLAIALAIVGADATKAAMADPVIGIPDPAGSEVPALTLDECVASALTGNTELEQERLRRREVAGQKWQAVSSALPSVDVSGIMSSSRDPSFLLGETFSAFEADTAAAAAGAFPTPSTLTSETLYRAQVGGDWELNPFRILNAMGGVTVREDQLRYDLDAATHRIVERTMAAYYEVAASRDQLDAVETELAARAEFLDIARRRFSLGLATELDTLQAAVSHANLVPERRRAAKDLHNAASRLNILMGRDASTPIAVDPAMQLELEPIDGAALLQRVEGRPDLRSTEKQIEFLHKQRGVEAAAQRPSLQLGGAYGYVARDLETLGDYDYWNATLTLVLPVFDGFFTHGRVREVEGTIARTEQALTEQTRQARLEASTALEELLTAREILAAADLNVAAADRALDQITARFDVGKAEYLRLLNAQSDRMNARSQAIRARYDVLVQTAALKRSLGLDPRTRLSGLTEEDSE
ncbi:MAG: TolC family protein [bacterium]